MYTETDEQPILFDMDEPTAQLNELNEDACWQAVQTRSEGDTPFVYAVRSTGIYCRPTCPARRPRRELVAFFAQPAQAEQAGFRACRRCRPNEPHADTEQVALVERMCAWLEAPHASAPTLAALGQQFGLSPHHVQRTFKRVLGITPRQYSEACRLEAFKAQLRAGEDVTSALYAAGYGSSSRLYERAASQLGMTPGTYRRGGAGMQIGYTLFDSPLGRVLLAATERGLCAVSLGDDDATLEAALSTEYPAASMRRDDAALHEQAAHVLRYLHGQQPHLDLPLDVQATAFQWQVWQALQAIPYGSTRSYQQIASEQFDNPQAARAVARACATNPVSLVVPCHRVLRDDGSLGGYRWGLERKQALLDIEREHGEAAR